MLLIQNLGLAGRTRADRMLAPIRTLWGLISAWSAIDLILIQISEI